MAQRSRDHATRQQSWHAAWHRHGPASPCPLGFMVSPSCYALVGIRLGVRNAVRTNTEADAPGNTIQDGEDMNRDQRLPFEDAEITRSAHERLHATDVSHALAEHYELWDSADELMDTLPSDVADEAMHSTRHVDRSGHAFEITTPYLPSTERTLIRLVREPAAA
jgi:hypothetical protein